MNHIFHYYVSIFLAREAGFSEEEALILAEASQFVDQMVFDLDLELEGKHYFLPATHHYGIFKKNQENEIWKPFHFFPSGLSRESQTDPRFWLGFNVEYSAHWNPDCVVPHSDPVKELLVAALKTKNLYRIGIALHTYADTWAHQGFCGSLSDLNKVPRALNLPPLGHSNVESRPDISNLVWEDLRLAQPKIENRSRFLKAAQYIYRYLATFKGKNFDRETDILQKLETCFGPESQTQNRMDQGGKLQHQLDKGVKSLKTLGSKLQKSLEFETKLRTEDGENLQIGYLKGFNDEEIAQTFIKDYRMKPLKKQVWLEPYINKVNSGTDFLASDLEGKINWIKNQAAKLSKLNILELKAGRSFLESPLYEFSLAAQEHLKEAQEIMRQF